MQPEIPQPLFSNGPTEPPKKSRKKIIIGICAAVLILIVAGVIAFFVLKKEKPQDSTKQAGDTIKAVQFGYEKEPIIYAGNKIYDACMLPQSIFEKHVEEYKDLSGWFGGDKVLEHPIKVDHGYIDRSISTVLEGDKKAREPGMTISETGVDSTVRARLFMSIADSYCHYGQGIASNLQYAKVHIIQPPTPLSSKLTDYLNKLKQEGRLAIETEGIQVYVEPVKEGDTENIVMIKKGETVVFVASPYFNIVQEASDIVAAILAKDPTGPMTAKYPAPYANLTNSCELFKADDFERLLGKQADSVTLETINLTEVDQHVAMRECSRYEVERVRQGEITTSDIALFEARTEAGAKAQMNAMKTKNEAKASSISDLGDEAYLVSTERKNTIIVRVGNRFVEVVTSGETKDATPEAFNTRTLPVAKVVVENLKR